MARAAPRADIPAWRVFRQPWPATETHGPTAVGIGVFFQYRADRARRTLRGIDGQVAKAEKAGRRRDSGQANRFVALAGGTGR